MVLQLLYWIGFIDLFVLGLFMPVASVHVLSLGGSRFLVGVLSSLNCLLQLLSGPIIGSLSDSLGRKPLLLLSLLGSLTSNVLYAFDSLYVYILARIIFGCTCQVQILNKALIVDNVPSEEQGKVFGKAGALSAIAFIIGPIIGGHITSYSNGFYYLSLIMVALSIINIGISQCLPNVPPKKSKPGNTKPSPWKNLASIKWNTFWDVFALKYLGESAFSMFFQSFGMILIEVYKTSKTEIGYIIAFLSFSMIISNLSIRKVNDTFYKTDVHFRKRNLHAFIGMTVSFSILYMMPSYWAFIIFMVPFAIFKILLDTTWMEMVVARTTESDKGTVMGAFESLLQMAGLVTPLINGFVGDKYGYEATILVAIGPLVAATIVATQVKPINSEMAKNKKKL